MIDDEAEYEPAIIIFNAGMHAGDFGSIHREECEKEKSNLGLSENNVARFISKSDTNNIKDVIPNDYQDLPVKGPNGTIISNKWSSMWGGTIVNSLSAAGVLPSDIQHYWWSGSLTDGTHGLSSTSDLCADWSGTPDTGIRGRSDLLGSGWIKDGLSFDCSIDNYILCAAW